MWNAMDQTAGGSGGMPPLRLFHASGVRSQGVLIALMESGLPFDLFAIDGPGGLPTARDALDAVDPFAEPPVLLLLDGSTFREPAAIMELVADLAPCRHLVPTAGTLDRILLVQWMHFVAAEIGTDDGDVVSTAARSSDARIAWIDLQLSTRDFLLGPRFSIADIHLWVRWNARRERYGSRLEFPNLERWFTQVAARPAVVAVCATDVPLA